MPKAIASSKDATLPPLSLSRQDVDFQQRKPYLILKVSTSLSRSPAVVSSDFFTLLPSSSSFISLSLSPAILQPFSI